jgi:hypothetical protein
MEEKLEFTKMRERLDWAMDMLKEKAKKEELDINPDVLFTQACEMARTLFVRSEIAYSGKK